MGEEKILRREEVVVVDCHPVIDRLQRIGTLRHNDYIRTVQTARRLTQPAVRQHMVLAQRMIVFCYQYRYRRLHIPVLERVIEDDHVDFRIETPQFTDARHAVLAYSDNNVSAELMIYHIRLVAYILRRRRASGHNETLGGAPVSTAEHCDTVSAAESIDEILDMRSLARSSDSKITHTDHRDVEFHSFERIPVEKFITQIGYRSVHFRAREQHGFR